MSNNCLNITTTINLIDDSFTTSNCGDVAIDLNNLLPTPINEIKTFNNFTNLLQSELIDVKNRQSISAYPTLRLIYDDTIGWVITGSYGATIS